MSDFINRKKAVLKVLTELPATLDAETVQRCIEIVSNMPPEQPEIIRCKDCKHGSANGKYGCRVYHYKRYETHDMEPDDFCSRAERRQSG